MTDLTAITTPFGLLDRETQEALRAHGGPYQVFAASSMWAAQNDNPLWFPELAYRVKPAPPKPREYWVTWDDRGKLLVFAAPVRDDVHEIIHVREVLE